MTPKELKEIREAHGLNMAEWARKIEVPYRTIQNWENGKRTPPAIAISYYRHLKNCKL